MTSKTLTSSQRQILENVAEATFANPFESRRYELDAMLTKVSTPEASPGHASREHVAGRLLHTVQELLYDVLDSGALTFRDFAGRDRELVMYAALFASFLRHEPDLTAHAIEQLATPHESLPVKFARGALERLTSYGFDREQSVRFFGLIYQISRAYHFISTTLPGKSASMEALRARLWQNVFTADLQLYEFHLWNRLEDFSTFLLGETGTGKGTAARALGMSGWIPYHETGNHFAGNLTDLFIPINLSQFTESLIESELFGHEKGSFTGAIKPHDGVFARCHRHGTIFLDEIGEVSTSIQIKLLNVLQERAFTPVGSHKPSHFYGRVIAATNQSVDELRHSGGFRDDFFYRLCSDIIVMPSLRQRIREDESELELLLEHIVTRISGEPMPRLVTRVLDVIHARQGLEYDWAGNVRELEQCVRRVLITGDYQPLAQCRDTRDHLTRMARRLECGDYTANDLLAEYSQQLYTQLGSYEAVGERLGLDRRTVKKYISSLAGEA